MKEIRIRCWIESDGKKLFGPGPAQLLKHIKTEGSISKAAKRMGMSYKKAWDIVQHLNTTLTEPVVISQKGGKKGGGAAVTEKGISLLESYDALTRTLTAVARENQKILSLM